MNLPTIRQIQIIADVLKTATLPDGVTADAFTEPWRDYYQWCAEWMDENADDADARDLEHDFIQQVVAYSKKYGEDYRLIRAAMECPTTYLPADQSLADVQDIQWLWKGWLLRGLPSLLAGVPGTGKSYLALDLGRRIICGTQYPDGTAVQEPGPVLYVDAENTPAIHKERLSPWPKAALRQLFFVFPASERLVINLDDHADRERLFDMAWVIRPALIIVDSYGSCTLKGENNKEDVQVLLATFNRLAREFNCGVLVVHHLRKRAADGQLTGGPMTLDAIRGSSHIAAMARHIWGLQFVRASAKPSLSDPRRLWIMKTNVGAAPNPLGVTFGPHPDNAEVAQLRYGEAPEPYREPTRVEACADWILAQLVEAGEPVKPKEIVERGEREGFYEMLIYRARKRLGDRVIDTHGRRNPHNAWALPEWGEGGEGKGAE